MAMVLVVDNAKEVRQEICRVLNHAGHQVFEARDGQEATDQMRVHRPSLVFVDLRLPDAGGLKLIGQLRETHPDTRIIAMSGG